jgi:uncharacterized protein (TIGR03663 family)
MTAPWLAAIIGMIILGMALRWVELDARPMHHDESLHGAYSKYQFNEPERQFYKYNPMLHGPLLYHMVPLSFYFFGETKLATRIPIALIACVLLFAPLLLSRRVDRSLIFLWTAVLALSPSILYWGRFIRHDMMGLALLIGIALTSVISHSLLKFSLLGLLIGLHFCVKEDVYVQLVMLFGFLIFEAYYSLRKNESSLFMKMARNVWDNWGATLLGIGLAVFVYCYFYSAGFQYWDGVLDGLYRKSLHYWFDQHHAERISGPFSFQFLILSIYELPIVILLLAQVVHFYLGRGIVEIGLFLLTLIIAALMHLQFNYTEQWPAIWSNILKLKIPLDLYLAIPLVLHAVLTTRTHLLDKKPHLAIASYIAFASLFTYSYLGEKVPWLALYPLVALVIYLGAYFEDLLNSWFFNLMTFFVIVGLCVPLLRTNFTHAGEKTELISQVHTTKAYEETMFGLEEHLYHGRGNILILGSNLWPSTWYLYGLPGFIFSSPIDRRPQFDFVVGDHPDEELERQLEATHSKRLVPMRSWWLPDYKKLGVSNVLKAWAFGTPWNEPGTKWSAIFERRIPSGTIEPLENNH